MRCPTAVIAAAVALAIGAAPAAASTPLPTPSAGQSNVSDVNQGSPEATGGEATATGGDGGDAYTGNTQYGNGNAIAVSIGGDADAEGGDTEATSGDATGGDGGDAGAKGGDADASNEAVVVQSNESSGSGHSPHGDCGCKSPSMNHNSGDSQSNESHVKQGDPSATGGEATATGGDGGDAYTGNTQYGNGNAIAVSIGGDADAEGGDTEATSGDATGGDGGDAGAKGGDADASNEAVVVQSNESSGSGHSPHGDCGCKSPSMNHNSGDSQSNESHVKQGDPSATGGEATATGGDGGDAYTGNTQEHNGNAYAKSEPQEQKESKPCGCEHGKERGHDNDADAKGGDTEATSGDATGGDGGDAGAKGGDADASNEAVVVQSNRSWRWKSGHPSRGDCGCKSDSKHSSSGPQSNVSDIKQGDPEATGGEATATGGEGGDAYTGNTQEHNGNAYAESKPQEKQEMYKSCGCDHGKGGGHNDADAEGGDTTATSGDATGGDGGGAYADGGDAEAENEAGVFQFNSLGGSRWLVGRS